MEADQESRNEEINSNSNYEQSESRSRAPAAPPQDSQLANRYPSQFRYHNPPPPYYQYPGYYPPPVMQPPAHFRPPYYHRMTPPRPPPPTHMNFGTSMVGRRRYPFRPTVPLPPAPTVQHQFTPHEADVAGSRQALSPRAPVPATNPAGGRDIFQDVPLPLSLELTKPEKIISYVLLKKESLRLEPDQKYPGQFLVSFTFDASTAGSITVVFFAHEHNGHLMPMMESLLPPVMVPFEQGQDQKFRQPSGTGIDVSTFAEAELFRWYCYPLAVKVEATVPSHVSVEGNPDSRATNFQITEAIFEKYKGSYRVKAVNQILLVNENRYTLQDIYGIEKSVDDHLSEKNPRKECITCLSKPCEVLLFPCGHLCLCIGCAKHTRFQMKQCPVCRQLVHRLLELNVIDSAEDQ